MKKLYLLLLSLALTTTTLVAAPAKRGVTREGKLSNGQTVTLTLHGDETFHFYTTPDGIPMRQVDNGTWIVDARDVKSLWAEASARRGAHRQQLAQHTRRLAAARVGEAQNATTGKKRGLLILVNFTDKKMTVGTQAIYNQLLNGENNPYGKNYGSVREYFLDQSYGQLDITFDVVGPVTVSNKMAYYGGNDSQGNDKAPEKMIREACLLADAQVDFSQYDWDGDGEVENIYVTYAGYSEAQGGADDTIWPHQWQLSESSAGALRLDGVTVNTYATGSELMGSSGKTLDGIGTMCHEYGHCLGLPDFYDTEYSGNFGMSEWSIMDSGSYNNDGYCPSGYTSYERWFCGWLEPVELQPNTQVKGMHGIEANPEAYVIYNDGNHNEYYLLENHTKTEWNKYQAGKGLLVLHVDYSPSVWAENTVNNQSSHQRMTIIPADNKYDSSTYMGEKYSYANAGDLYPNSGRNTELTDESTPAAKLYNRNTDGTKLMHKPITDITQAGTGLISFTFMKQPVYVPVPTIDEAKSMVSDTEVIVAWNAVEGASSYNLRYSLTDPNAEDEGTSVLDALVLLEDFEKFKNSADASQAISKFDDLTVQTGWTGENVFKGIYGAKIGTASKAGSITSPKLEGSKGDVTVYVVAYAYKNDNTKLKVSLLNTSGSEVSSQEITPASYNSGTADAAFAVTFSGAPSTYKVKVSAVRASKCRAYVAGVYAFNGTYTRSEIESLFEGSDPSTTTTEPEGTTEIVYVITNTYYNLYDLPDGQVISISVQTVDADGNLSEWSEPVSYTIGAGDEVAVESIVAPIIASDTRVFDLSGRRVSTTHSLRSGIYVRGGRKHLLLR